MPNRIPPRRLTLVCTLVSLCIFSTLVIATARPPQRRRAAPAPPPPAVNCKTVTDADIVTAIQNKIKADRRFKGQWSQINVMSRGYDVMGTENNVIGREHKVTLEGWVDSQDLICPLITYATETSCVTGVETRVVAKKHVGCGPNEKPCGDGCVAKDSDCNAMPPPL